MDRKLVKYTPERGPAHKYGWCTKGPKATIAIVVGFNGRKGRMGELLGSPIVRMDKRGFREENGGKKGAFVKSRDSDRPPFVC